jgi:hypothetical protein
MAHDDLNPDKDPFGPPAVSTVVQCLHCGEQYDSYRIEWRISHDADGNPHGFWCCPIPGCNGIGFGFDILPIDPHYRDEHGGWSMSDDEDDEFDEFDELDDDFDDGFEFGDSLEFEPIDRERISPTTAPRVGRSDDDIPF